MTGQKKKPSISSLEQTTSTYLKLKTKYSRDMLNHIISVSKKKEGMIAEAGPGLGHFAVECRNRGFSYIGFEASEQLRGELIRKDLEVIDAYVPPIPLKDKQCDIFYASMILEHLATYHEASYFISEIFRVLNDRGYVCLVVPNYLTSKEFFFEMDGDVQVVYQSLKPELEAVHQRSITELGVQGNSLALRICSEDMVSMRAALNGWLRLIRIAVEMNATIES